MCAFVHVQIYCMCVYYLLEKIHFGRAAFLICLCLSGLSNVVYSTEHCRAYMWLLTYSTVPKTMRYSICETFGWEECSSHIVNKSKVKKKIPVYYNLGPLFVALTISMTTVFTKVIDEIWEHASLYHQRADDHTCQQANSLD